MEATPMELRCRSIPGTREEPRGYGDRGGMGALSCAARAVFAAGLGLESECSNFRMLAGTRLSSETAGDVWTVETCGVFGPDKTPDVCMSIYVHATSMCNTQQAQCFRQPCGKVLQRLIGLLPTTGVPPKTFATSSVLPKRHASPAAFHDGPKQRSERFIWCVRPGSYLPQEPCHPVARLSAHRDPVPYPVHLERYLLHTAPGRQRVVRAHLVFDQVHVTVAGFESTDKTCKAGGYLTWVGARRQKTRAMPNMGRSPKKRRP